MPFMLTKTISSNHTHHQLSTREGLLFSLLLSFQVSKANQLVKERSGLTVIKLSQTHYMTGHHSDLKPLNAHLTS